MNGESRGSAILWIELWHGLLVLALLVCLVPLRILDPWGLVLGALFMGVNFLLLGYGVRWLLGPFAARGRVRAGIFLLFMKFVLFLGLLSALLLQTHLEARSFAVGVSSLLVAVIMERVWASRNEGE